MKNRASDDSFRTRAAVTMASLAALAAVPWLAPRMYAAPWLRFPAALTVVARSHATLFNVGVTGYYEQLFALGEVKFGNPSPHPFRVYTFPFIGKQPLGPKPAGTRRIVLLGSSLETGPGVSRDRNYGSLFERRLNADLSPAHFEVANLAVGGYKLTQVMDVALEDAPPLQPDVYILSLSELQTFRNWDEHLLQVIQQGLDPKYEFLRDTIRAAGVRREDDKLTILDELAPYRLEVIRQALLQIKSRAAQDHAFFLVILTPSLEDADWSTPAHGGRGRVCKLSGYPGNRSARHVLGNPESGAAARHSIERSP